MPVVLALLCLTAAGATPDDPGAEGVADRVGRLVPQLGHREFAKREAAAKELDAIGEPALDALRKAAASEDAEVRERAARVIAAITARIRAAAAKADLARLQGTWYTVSTSHEGTTTPEDKADTITYEGTDYVQRSNGRVTAAGTIAIVDATASPKQIDYFGTFGVGNGAHVRATYTLKGEDHQICSAAGARPAEFSGKAGFLRVTKRDKPGPPEVRFTGDLLPTDLQLPESLAAVRRVVVTVRSGDGGAGTLTLDPNAPKLDGFGDAAGGGGNPSPVVKLDFTLKFVKKDGDRRLYELRGPKITSRLSLAVLWGAAPWGDARLLVHGRDGGVRYAIGLRPPAPPTQPLPPPCHPGCFPAGTRVHVPGGTKRIEEVREGDLVMAVDAAGKPSPAKATGVFATRNRLLEVRTAGRALVTTATQPVGLEGGGFRAAGELRPGDRVWQWVGGERKAVAVREVTAAGREAEVFNLILGGPTGFVAGDFLVRSKPPAGPLRP